MEEALVEMYLAGVSVRRVEDITEALWGTRVSPSTVSELNQKIYAQIETWRNRPIEGHHAYVFLDGLWLKRSWGGEVRNVSLLVAIGVNDQGFREVLAVTEGSIGVSGLCASLQHIPNGRIHGGKRRAGCIFNLPFHRTGHLSIQGLAIGFVHRPMRL